MRAAQQPQRGAPGDRVAGHAVRAARRGRGVGACERAQHAEDGLQVRPLRRRDMSVLLRLALQRRRKPPGFLRDPGLPR